MITVNQNFQQIYKPHKAFLVFQSIADTRITYIESYDIAPSGRPINAHPLSTAESVELAHSLAESKELNTNFLQSKGILPDNLLYTSIGLNGYAIWYTPAKQVHLSFSPSLNIPDGTASVPAMIWKANKTTLEIFAIRTKAPAKPNLDTELFHAPFFNIYDSGKVCMGTVNVSIREGMHLEDFTSAWEHYFFNSNFSHAMLGHCPVKGNMVQLWQKLLRPDNAIAQEGSPSPSKAVNILNAPNVLRFPESVMKTTGRTLKDLIS